MWESFYDHYATHTHYRDHDILIKADDDIVFIDLPKFRHFVDGIRTLNLYFPNIVNNDVGLYVQGIRSAHPNVVRWYNEYRIHHRIDFEQRIRHYFFAHDYDGSKAYKLNYGRICPLTSGKCELTTGGVWSNASYERGDFAADIHAGFLSNPDAFIKASAGNSTDPRYVKLRRRISINLFGGFFALFRELFTFYLDKSCCDDEGFVGKWPSLTHLDHYIDTHFTISHFAFHPQYERYQADLQDAYERYEQLADRIYRKEFDGKHLNETSNVPLTQRRPINTFYCTTGKN
jgi:hypothetical protein